MRSRTAVVGLTLVAALVTACGGASSPGGGTGDAGDVGPLVGAWRLVAADPPIDVPDDARVTLTIEDDAGQLRAGGTAACNSYGGALQATSGSWSLSELAWTEMGCDEPRMAAEAAYLDALQRVDGWAVDGAELRLSGPDVTLTFDQLAAVDPAALTGTTWVLSSTVDGVGDDAAVSSLPTGVAPAELRLDDDGTFTLFTGCRDFAGEWTTSGDQVVLPSWGQTDDSRGVGADGGLDCSADAEAQERAVLAVVEGGFVPMVEGDSLTLQQGAEGLIFRAT